MLSAYYTNNADRLFLCHLQSRRCKAARFRRSRGHQGARFASLCSSCATHAAGAKQRQASQPSSFNAVLVVSPGFRRIVRANRDGYCALRMAKLYPTRPWKALEMYDPARISYLRRTASISTSIPGDPKTSIGQSDVICRHCSRGPAAGTRNSKEKFGQRRSRDDNRDSGPERIALAGICCSGPNRLGRGFNGGRRTPPWRAHFVPRAQARKKISTTHTLPGRRGLERQKSRKYTSECYQSV